ncbi:hypothetical protein TWF730_004481 [Orbilia blumenaviensis]|uniref:Uncharacterized protein n=1 Tax=Orbilia blumenaviensis TaxID=1796055 RepID=A0AAV9U124_9PEZI
MATSTSSPFLRLPRELRDQVYQYFIYPPPPSRVLTTNPDYPEYDWPKLDTALLTVNKQIHDEVADVFYSRTVFPIRISMTVIRNRVYDQATCDGLTYYICYYAPWEGLFLVYNDSEVHRRKLYAFTDPNQLYDEEDVIPYDLDSTEDFTAEQIRAFWPAPRYRSMIRRIKFDVCDVWPMGIELDLPYRIKRGTPEAITRLLKPLAYRLEKVFGETAANNIEIEIKAVAEFNNPPSTWNKLDIGRNGLVIAGRRSPDDFVETLGYLTTGSWIKRYTFKLDMPALKNRFPELEGMIRRKLDLYSRIIKGTHDFSVKEEDIGTWPDFSAPRPYS